MHEFEFIEKITAPFAKTKKVVRGVGDDAAVYQRDRQNYSLFTTDALVEGVHFKKSDAPALIGRKALAVNLSDVAAMGGEPEMVVVTLGVNPRTPYSFYQKVYLGMEALAEEYGVAIVGGDTVRSEKFFINVALTGIVAKKKCAFRSGAKVGDAICVTGQLGGSIKGKQFGFTPRLKEAHTLVGQFDIHAMIDLSDGLAGDLPHILKESQVGARIELNKIPIASAVSAPSQKKKITHALCDGEDFELLFTLPDKEVAAAQKAFKKKKGFPRITQIGEIVSKKEGLQYLNAQGKSEKLQVDGYTQF